MNIQPTRRLVYLALLVSLTIVLTRIASINIPFEGVVTLRIGFGPLPVMLAGLLFGPFNGAIVGVLGDIIGFQLNPLGGPYLPQFTAIAALHGLLPPLLWRLAGRQLSLRSLFAVVAGTNLVTALLLTPYVLNTALGIPWLVTFPGRLASQAVIIPLYTVIARKVLLALRLRN